MSQEKKTVLVVSFGTSYEQTCKATIGAIEADIAAAWPNWEVRRAFTSGMILRVLKQRDGVHIDSVTEAMERLVANKTKILLVQPTHIINGDEYEKMLSQIEPYRHYFKELYVGKPLLTSSADFELAVEGFMKGVAEYVPSLSERDALVLMGHGTQHHTDAVYAALDYRFQDMGHHNVFVGTVEGYPGLNQVAKRVRQLEPQRVILAPFMIVAGDHAINDMAGGEEDSWKTFFERQGYQTECILKGLGEYSAIRDIYVKHGKAALCGK